MRVGIYGGSFNPPHMGHINALTTVLKKAGLEKLCYSCFCKPPEGAVEGPTPKAAIGNDKKGPRRIRQAACC